MAGPPQAVDRRVEPVRPEPPAVRPEAPAREPEAPNSLLAAMADLGLDWLAELFAPGLDLLDWFSVELFGVPLFGAEEAVDSEGSGAGAAGPAAVPVPAPEKAAPSAAEARPSGPGESLRAGDQARGPEAPAAPSAGLGEAAAPTEGPAAGQPAAAGTAAAEPAPEPARRSPRARAATGEQAAGEAGGGAGGDGGPLGAWRSKVHRAIAAVRRPKLKRGQGEAVASLARSAVDKRAEQTAKIPGDAKQAVPEPKKPADLPPFPDDETKTAVAKLDPKLGRAHKPHTLPPLQAREGSKYVPEIPPDVPPAPAPAREVPARRGQPGAEPTAKDDAGAKAKEAKAKEPDKPKGVEAKTPTEAAQAKVPAPGVTVTTEAPEIPVGDAIVQTKADVGAVVARLLAEPERHATRVVNDAIAVAYNGGLAKAWPEISSRILPGEIKFVDQELRRVAAAAGDTEEMLNQKIVAARTQLTAQGTAIEADVSTSLEDGRKDVVAADAAMTRAISDWHRMVDEQVQARAAATKSGVDVAKIRADRDRLVEMVTNKAGQGVVVYEAAAKKFKAALETEVAKQRRAYVTAAKHEETDINKEFADLEKAERQQVGIGPLQRDYAAEGRVKYRPVKYWLDERLEALGAFHAGALREIDTEAEGYISDLNQAATEARNDVREWADRRLGYQRNWFQRLLDMVGDWMAQSQVQTAAWAKRRAADAAVQVDKDLEFLEAEANKLARMSKEERQLEGIALRADQRVIIETFMQGGAEDALGAVAAAMIFRLSTQRRPELLQAFDAQVMGLEEDQREVVYKIAVAESPGLDLKATADRLHDGFKGPGTTESEVFAALTGLTPIGGKAVEFAYKQWWHEDLRERLESELNDWLTWSSHDIDRANSLLAGQGADAIAIELDQAMHANWNGLNLGGTDEETIFEALRNKSPEEIAAIKKAYKARYHKDLELEVQEELHEGWIRGTHDEDRGKALFASDTERADVIAMDQAMHGGWLGLGLGTDRKTLEKIYVTNDKELEQEADAKGWDSKTLARKKAERRSHLDTKYFDKYKLRLSAQFVDEMSDEELDLVAGLREQNWNKVDAARIAQEHNSIFYADDKVINDAMQGHFKRTYADEKRDRNLKIDEAMAADHAEIEDAGSEEARIAAREKYSQKWPPEYVHQLRMEAQAEARKVADVSAQNNFPELEKTYDKAYKGTVGLWGGPYLGLREDVAHDTQLTQHDKAMALIEGKGTLTEAQEVNFAIRGVGTDNDIVRDVFTGKSKDELDALGAEWESKHREEGEDKLTFKDFVLDDYSGREYQETNEQLSFGEAVTPTQKLDRAGRLLDFEKSTWFDWGSKREVEVMEERYQLLAADAQEYEKNEALKGKPGFSWTKHAELWGKVEGSAAAFDSAVTSHRKSVDVISDTVTQIVGAVITAIVVVASIAADIATAGGAVAATPGVIAFLGSMWGAITVGAIGLGLTMLTKRALTGKAYGWEDAGVDLAVGAVDIATMAATTWLKVGGRIMKGSKSLLTLFSKGRVGRILSKGIVAGAEGMIQAAPGAVTGQLLNPENFRKGDNAIVNVLSGAGMQVGLAGVMSFGMATLHGLVPEADYVRMRTDPAYQNEIFQRSKAKNPALTRDEFLQRLDGLISQHVGFSDPRMQKAMRAKLLEHIPSGQHGLYADVPIVVVSPEEFNAFAGSRKGRAVTVIRNGEPAVVMRSGSSLNELAFEGPHLQQIRDPKNAPKVALLEEHRMERWDLLTFDEKVEAYRAKVDLEIEAHQKVVESLDAQRGKAADPVEWEQARQKARDNLEDLQVQREKVDAITPQERAAAIADPSKGPDFLDQPARLFSKDPRQRLASEHGPIAPADVDAERANVRQLRKEIAGLENRLGERGKLSESERKNLDGLRAKLDEHYRAVPQEERHAAAAKLFDQEPGESLEAYFERLTDLEAEVNRATKKAGHDELREAYEQQWLEVSSDIDQQRLQRNDLEAVQKKISDNSAQWLEVRDKLKRSRNRNAGPPLEPDELANLNDLEAKLSRENAELHASKAKLVADIAAPERRGSLFYAGEPWTQVSFRDTADKNINAKVGLAGELHRSHVLQDEGFKPRGRTVDSTKVKSMEEFRALLAKTKGRQGVDGFWFREEPDALVYLVDESKTTADSKPSDPVGGAGKLDRMKAAGGKGERQLSRKWVGDRLGTSGLEPQDLKNITAGLETPGKPVDVEGSAKKVIVRKIYSQTYRDSQGVTRTAFYEVEDVGGINVEIKRSFDPRLPKPKPEPKP
jgi:hypothetical protein